MMSTTDIPTENASEPHRDPFVAASDGDLLDAWKRDRCREALTALIDRYSVLVLSVCRRSCRNRSDADDAFQSTFLYLVRSAAKIRNPQHLPGWLHRVAQRAAIATLGLSSPSVQAAIDFPSDPSDPLDRLTQRHAAIVLDEELADLPEHYRTAIVLHILHGESYAALAQRWGTTVGAVRGRVQRGKQILARRLRSRGIVPVIAFSAAVHWTVPQADAGQAAIDLVGSDAFPHDRVSPIAPPLLQSLLTQGSSAMTKSFVASSGLLGVAVLIFFLNDRVPAHQAARAEGLVLAQLAETPPPSGADFVQPIPPGGATTAETATSAAETRATSRIGAAAIEALEQDVELPPNASLSSLAELIHSVAGVPVRIDARALKFAKASPTTAITFGQGQRPLRSALHRVLRPLGLRATVDDEGIVITADHSVLVHQGIGVSQWINVDEEAERAIASKLADKVAYAFIEEPLANALRLIAEDQDLPILLDRTALADTPHTPDAPITLALPNVSLRTYLDLMLRELELVYTIQGEILVITTPEIAELHPLSRIYWLEGTGLTGGGGSMLIDAVQAVIEPDAWEYGGGTSTLRIVTGGGDSRPAIIVSAPYRIHEQIESLLAAARKSHFGPDPPFEPAQSPARPAGSMGGMGMGGMGGGGMGGTGGGMGGSAR